MLISLIITIIVVLLCLWLISIIPVPESNFPLKTVLYVLVVIIAIVYLLKFLPNV